MNLENSFLQQMVIIVFVIFSTATHANTTNHSIHDIDQPNIIRCKKYDVDTITLLKNPGIYYYRSAFCRLDNIHNKEDFQETISFFIKSARNNYALSYFALGTIYWEKYKAGSKYFGEKGTPADLISAIYNYEKASELGSVLAQENLGEIYLDHANVSVTDRNNYDSARDVKNKDAPILLPDINKTIYWFTMAAKNGNAVAQGMLSELYEQGLGVPQDYILAYVWDNLYTASQYRFNPNVEKGIAGTIMEGEKNGRNKLYSALTNEQKNKAQNLLTEYSNKYFIAPSSLDEYCQALQSDIIMKDLDSMLSRN